MLFDFDTDTNSTSLELREMHAACGTQLPVACAEVHVARTGRSGVSPGFPPIFSRQITATCKIWLPDFIKGKRLDLGRLNRRKDDGDWR
jgi:hypothetical protein